MFVFAHLRKCAGTSVVRAAVKARLVLPPSHRNGHPAGPDGHALAGLSSMTPDGLAAVLQPLALCGVQFVAIEWDFPRIERFPPLDLTFFTVFRDPVGRFLSNFAYDRTNGFANEKTIEDYAVVPTIWRQPNYYVRFFAGLTAHHPVGPSDVDYATAVLTERFRYAFLGEDLPAFLRDGVGLPIRSLAHANRTAGLLHRFKRVTIDLTEGQERELRRRNSADYELLDRLRAHRDRVV